MARLFISINCDDKTKKALLSIQEQIKSQSVKGSFSRPDNLHLTLVFIGETPQDQIPAICSVIEKAMDPQAAPFSLTLSKTGCFTHSYKELWWIGTEHSDPFLGILKNIRQHLTRGLSAQNINFDNRPFKPHITLGREIRHDKPIKVPQQEISFPVNRISLMQSERINGVLVYTEIFGRDFYDF